MARRTAEAGAILLLLSALALPSRAQQGTAPEWLTTLNLYRSVAGVAPVKAEPGFTQGAAAHARYVVEEDDLTIDEDPASPWFTPEGDAAAATSLQLGFPESDFSDTAFIETWMSNAFTAPQLTSPTLVRTGFGSFSEVDAAGIASAAAIDVLRGRTSDPEHATYPVFWPGDGATVGLTQAFEAPDPDPLSACQGYGGPVGLPLSVQLPEVPDATGSTLLRDGEPVEHCLIDADSYTNPDAAAQSEARAIMQKWRFAVIVPRDPLVPGSTYTASMTVNGQEHSWSFTSGSSTTAPLTTLTGTPGDDTLEGTDGDDTVFSGRGDDIVTAGRGADLAYGDPGTDMLRGNIGSDVLFGGTGFDRLSGGRGDDILRGGSGDDLLKGRGGTNTLDGGDGVDTCISTSSKDVIENCEKLKRAH